MQNTTTIAVETRFETEHLSLAQAGAEMRKFEKQALLSSVMRDEALRARRRQRLALEANGIFLA